MDNQDKSTFSLDDEEIVEEEVIDRDEEYDDGYEDDYEDEDYGDEEYEDEDYGDEEYDDGYNDDYYDDRLNKVLDEIAELKRGMVPATVQQPQQPVMPPQYIYHPSVPSAGSEVVMYNEISRLRDELAKNQSSLEMQKELARIKEDMARDQRFAEAQYNAEIQRLQSKIDELLKNAEGPQSDLSDEDSTHVEGGNSKALNLDKLLSINEAVLRATRDSDARIQNEIAQLKKQFEDFPSLKELNGAISAVKKALDGAEGINPETVAKLSADIAALKATIEEKGGVSSPTVAPASVYSAVSSDVAASELLRQLYDIKSVLGSASDSVVRRTQVLSDLVNEYKKVNLDVQSHTKQYKDKLTVAYAFAKKLAACGEQDAVDLIIAANSMVAGLGAQQLTRSSFNDVVAFCSENGIMSITSAIRDSADKFFGICEKLENAKISAYGEHLAELAAQVNILENNARQAENSEIMAQLVAALSEETPDEGEVKDLISALTDIKVSDIIELPQVDVPDDYKPASSENADSIFTRLDELKSAVLDNAVAVQELADKETAPVTPAEPAVMPEMSDDAVQQLSQAIGELKAKLETLTQAADIAYALEEIRKNYLDVSEKLVDISEELQNTERDAAAVADATASSQVLSEEDRQQMLDDLIYIRGKVDEHEEFLRRIEDVRTQVNDVTAETVETDKALDDRFSALVSEVTAQFDKLYEDLSNVVLESETSILGKIGEDTATNAAIESAKSDILADTQSIKDTLLTVTDSIYALPLNENLEATRADILAETQSIKDSLMVLSDQLNDMSASVTMGTDGDAMEQLRADVASLLELTTADDDAASVERQKILEDIAFLREQAELAIASDVSDEQPVDVAPATDADSDKLIAYLDDLSARIEKLNVIADDTAVLRDNAVAISDNVSAVADGVISVNDGMANVTESVNAALDAVNNVSNDITGIADTVNSARDAINTVNDNISGIVDSINATQSTVDSVNANIVGIAESAESARDAATAALDALSPITEQLNAILDRLDANAEASYEAGAADSEHTESEEYAEGYASVTDEELIELKDGINTILDTFPLFPQADDVVAARDNTYSILETLSAMPQADDVVVTRDNVAAILDAVNALSDSIADALGVKEDNSALESDIAALRESIDAANENIAFMRQKLEEGAQSEEQVEDLANIMQDIGLVLDKIEEYENVSASNKQEIIDAVAGIREEIHINTLDENMSAAGIDGETRDALVGEIAEIRERLGNIEGVAQSLNELNNSMLDGINTQLTDIQSALEERLADSAVEQETATLSNENMQAIFDELSGIKERLSVQSEYDTVEEILSLREDIKASRIVDGDEVSSELEAIKNELAYISSGNIIDEIRALREDITGLPNNDGGMAPTDGEVNLVLNEIVSLRDELFAFKDEVLNATASVNMSTGEQAQPEIEGNTEEISTILDELTALRADQSVLGENIDELKDIVSRRTTIASSDGEAEAAPSAGEINVVLDEIINLKNDVESIADSVSEDKFAAMSEKVDELVAVIDELRLGAGQNDVAEQSVSVDLTPVMDRLESMNAALDDIRLNREAETITDNGAVTPTFAEMFDELRDEIEDIKANISDIAIPVDYESELSELRAEIEALRAENEALRQESNDSVNTQLQELKDLIRQSMSYTAAAPQTGADGETSYAALIDEIRDLKDQVAVAQYAPQPVLDESDLQAIRDAVAGIASDRSVAAEDAQGLSAELGEIRDEIAQLRSLTAVSAGSEESAELSALRDELAELKNMLTSQENLFGVAEDVTAIRADVQTLRDEPDLGVMSEILALRDEFQALREEIEDVKRIAGETDKEADESLMSEVQSLRDQLFAISMANVNDPSSGESNYESYNNIILDELAAIRDQVSAAGSSSDLASNDIASMMEELESLRETIENRDDMIDSVAERIANINSESSVNDKIMQELAGVRQDLANQRDADMATLNFMSEMAHLLERQNQYLTQNSGSKLSDEIESLKAEIASADAVAEEVAKLRELMTQSGGSADNESILNELAELREELSREKPSAENDIVLDAIARLRDEITALAEREQARDTESDADLSESLTDLKNQLSQIADIVEPDEKPAPKERKSASGGTGAKRGKKPAAKSSSSAKKKSTSSGTGAKRGRKPASKSTVSSAPTTTERTGADLESVIDAQAAEIGGDDEMSLKIDDLVTSDAMDLADKLAKQVANKLIMEQLVEQLGDGGVSEERVDEILRDILPHEFTTIAETEASDKVRRLANRLVLDKLRARLNGKKDDDD